MFISFGIKAPCNDAGPAFLLNEIGPTWHPLHITFLLVYSNIYPIKFPKIQLVSKSSLVRPSLIPHTACIWLKVCECDEFCMGNIEVDATKRIKFVVKCPYKTN